MKVEGLRDATRGVDRYQSRLMRTIYRVALDTARDVTQWEKQNHPWQNRTGEAERTVHCIAIWERGQIGLENRHMVFYGKFLELRNNGRFAILQEALRRFWGEMRAEIVNRMHNDE